MLSWGLTVYTLGELDPQIGPKIQNSNIRYLQINTMEDHPETIGWNAGDAKSFHYPALNDIIGQTQNNAVHMCEVQFNTHADEGIMRMKIQQSDGFFCNVANTQGNIGKWSAPFDTSRKVSKLKFPLECTSYT